MSAEALGLATAMLMASKRPRASKPLTAEQVARREAEKARSDWNREVDAKKAAKKAKVEYVDHEQTELTPTESTLADECAARHRIPKATVKHPAVIVPGDPFMTEKLRDPDYVPYCGPCPLMQRVLRVEDGFECPTCGNKSNYDLTKFNGNINVQYEVADEKGGAA